MNKQAAIQYKAYKLLLESDLTTEQREALIEIGFIDKIKSFFGAGAEVGGDLAKVFKDKTYQKQLVASQKNIKKELEDLKAIGAKVGMGDDFVNQFLQSLMSGAGLDPAKVASAKPTDGEAKSEAGATGEEAKPGTSVTPETLEKNPEVATKVIAAATGRPEEQVAAEIEKKKPDAAALTKLFSTAVAKLSNQKPDLVSKVLGALLSKGHIKLEGKTVNTRSALIKMTKEAHTLCENVAVMDRWQTLAGLQNPRSQLLYEGPATDELLKDIESKKIKSADALKAAVKGYKGDDLKDLESSQAQLIDAVKGDNAFPHFDTDLAAIIDDLKKGGAAKDEASPQDKKEAEKVKKEFGPAFKDVRAAIKPEEAGDEVLAAVIDAIDQLKAVEIA